MGKLRNIIRDYFTFTRNERIGLYILIGIIVVLLVVNRLIFYFETPGEINRDSFEKYIESFHKEKEEQPHKKDQSLFSFNPNQIDSLSLDSLDMPASIKSNLYKYVLKGGSFRYRSDMRKLYGMNDSVFSALSPYIDLPEKPIVKIKPKRKVQAKMNHAFKVDKPKATLEEIKPIELNAASVEELKSLYGIGEVLSSRIVKYRNLLGGYYQIEQLKEVYGLSEETYQAVAKHLAVDRDSIKKIDINFASGKELVRHPYLKWDDVNSIFEHKSEVGFIKTIDQLLENEVLNDTIYNKISPYLKTKNP